MTVAELKKILNTMADTEEVVFQEVNVDAWSGHLDGYRAVNVARVTTATVVKAETEARDKKAKEAFARTAKEIIKTEEEAIKRCRSEKSIKKHEETIAYWKQYI